MVNEGHAGTYGKSEKYLKFVFRLDLKEISKTINFFF